MKYVYMPNIYERNSELEYKGIRVVGVLKSIERSMCMFQGLVKDISLSAIVQNACRKQKSHIQSLYI